MSPFTNRSARAVALTAAAGVVAGGLLAASPAPASPTTAPTTAPSTEPGNDRAHSHEPKHPLRIKAKRDAQRQAALQRKLETGKAFPSVARAKRTNQYVELERQGTDRVFVVLAEFGEERYPDPRFADDAEVGDPRPQQFTGPLHNQIPEPDRSFDNTTLWQADYDRAHYEHMYFNRMAKYYERQSSGRYSVEGDVTEWVKVPFNQALYGRDYCGSIVCSSTKALVRDSMAVWVQDRLDEGMTMPEIRAYLQTFDVEDRYDADGDGSYDEPDGFIDHFQIVHAGGDQASADPIYGSDAIWSHRWYANLQGGGPGGLPGVDVGSNGGAFSSDLVPDNPTGIWVGDYTIQPENGGLGVFAHEYGHDLGLPDLYDTSGNTGGAENSTGFWSLMSSGANIGDGGPDGIGDDPVDLSAWELLQMGWLDPVTKDGLQATGPFYGVADHGRRSRHRLSTNVPASARGVQAVFALLPDNEVPLDLGAPAAGDHMFYSGSGDGLNSSMTNLTVAGTALTARARYDIEEDWDYAFLEATTDGGATWRPVATDLSDTEGDQSGINASGTGITGASAGWVDLTATLPDGTNGVRFRYETDAAYAFEGFKVDEIAVDGVLVGTAETDDEGWEYDGFRRTTGSETQSFFNAYVLENRQYDGYDRSLRSAYNFGFTDTRPDWVEDFRYQDGMLVWYWNEEHADNNVGDHPGEGLLLPVDAHPSFSHWADGTLVRPRILAADATFGLERTDRIVVHQHGKRTVIGSRRARSTFDDSKRYWRNRDAHGRTGEHPGRHQPGWNSVRVPRTGTTVTVLRELRDRSLVVRVAPKS